MKRTKREALPWYRKPTYRGKISESEKRVLDSVRMRGAHPAPTYHDLPEEAKNYISSLELAAYDSKQEKLATTCILFTLMGAYISYVGYETNDTSKLIMGLAMAVLPWPYYAYKWKKNANDFMPDDDPNRDANNAMQFEWDLNYFQHHRSHKSNDS